MNKEEKDNVCQAACSEGFDYAFSTYSAFDEIKDKEFHVLRRAFVKASEDLKAYIDYNDYEEQ